MRILIASAMLFAAASCAWVPPPAMVAAPPPSPPAPVALIVPPPPPPAMVAYAPVPPPPVLVAAPAPAPFPFAPFAGVFGSPPAGRLTLSNFSFDTAHVEAMVTAAPDCTVREGMTASDFVLPLNGTRIIQSVPGADVCWRRAIDPKTASGAPPSTPGWTEWNRAFLSSGRSVDARL